MENNEEFKLPDLRINILDRLTGRALHLVVRMADADSAAIRTGSGDQLGTSDYAFKMYFQEFKENINSILHCNSIMPEGMVKLANEILQVDNFEKARECAYSAYGLKCAQFAVAMHDFVSEIQGYEHNEISACYTNNEFYKRLFDDEENKTKGIIPKVDYDITE